MTNPLRRIFNLKDDVMKKRLVLALKIIGIGALVYVANEAVHPPKSCVRMHVVNDAGEPISAIKTAGWNDVTLEVDRADANNQGYAMVSVRGKMASVGISSAAFNNDVFRAKYYEPGSLVVSRLFTHENLALNRWEPWGVDVEFVVNRIKNPVQMVLIKHNQSYMGHEIYYPVEAGVEVGFDMLEGDWMPPYGKGKEVDFICTLLTPKDAPLWSKSEAMAELEGMEKVQQRYRYDKAMFEKTEKPLTMKVRFVRPGDGLMFKPMLFGTGEGGGSALYHPHEAPASGYESEVILDARDEYRRPPLRMKSLVPIFRVRTQLAADGKTATGGIYGVGGNFGFCHYKDYQRLPNGQMDGGTDRINFDLSYKYNPNPASRSLEWNGVDARTRELIRENWRENQRP